MLRSLLPSCSYSCDKPPSPAQSCALLGCSVPQPATSAAHTPELFPTSRIFSVTTHTLCLHPPSHACIIPSRAKRGISSVGRAVASHATGQGFESPMLQIYNSLSLNDLGCFAFWQMELHPDLLQAMDKLPGSPGTRRA